MTVLQDAARGAAKPLRGPAGARPQTASILYDSPETLKAFADANGIEFALLSDVGSEVIQRYGILNRDPCSRTYDIPYPGTFALDANGRVTARFFEPCYQ